MSPDDVQTLAPDNEVSDQVDDAVGPIETPDAVRKRPRWIRFLLTGILVVGSVSACIGLGFTLYQQSELKRLQAQATATTHDYLVAMAAFDYQNLDANKGAITAQSTTDFAKKYDEMVAALRDIVVTSKGVATATADHVAVEHLDRNSATVVGFVDQHVTNVTAPQGNSQRYRMVVSLIRSDDHWVVDNVETV